MAFAVKLYWTDPTTRDVLSIRRLRTAQVPTWPEFLDILKSLFPGNGELHVTWRDEENDVISIGSQVEWDDAVESTSRPMKLFVMPSAKKNEVKEEEVKEDVEEMKKEEKKEEAKKEEEVEEEKPILTPEYFYSASGFVSLSSTDRSRLSSVVQSILTRYSAAPPQWLADAIRVVPTKNDFLVDVDITQLSLLLHRRAYHLLSNGGCVGDALALLDDCLSLFPNDAIARYNRACCYARLGRVEESFAEIVKYFECGGRDFESLRTDVDLVSLRAYERFVEYVKKNFNEDVSSMNGGVSGVESSVVDSAVSSVTGSRVNDDDEDDEEEEEEDEDDDEDDDEDEDDEEEDDEEEDDDDDDDDDEEDDDDDEDDDDEEEEEEEEESEDSDSDDDDVNESRVYESQFTDTTVDSSQAQESSAFVSYVDMSHITESQLDMSVLQSVPPIMQTQEENASQEVNVSQVEEEEEDDDDDEDEEEEEEEEEKDEELEKKLDLLGELGFVDREMVRKVLMDECNGDVERFLDEQCA